MLGNYCRQYRLEKSVTLTSISDNMTHLKALSSFEHGRSSNINHLKVYIELAKQLNDLDNFVSGLVEYNQ